MKADLYGTHAEQYRFSVDWRSASELGHAYIGERCDSCAHHGWSEGARTPRARCELHAMPTTQRARCPSWERAEEREPLSDEATGRRVILTQTEREEWTRDAAILREVAHQMEQEARQ